MVHGVFHRLALLVGALGPLGPLDGLFFVEPGIDTSDTATEAYRHRLSEHWGGVDLALQLETWQAGPEHPSRRQVYGAGIVDAFHQLRFRLAAGDRQLAALEAALARKPDLILAHRLPAMAPLLRTEMSLPPVVFDLDDVEHLAFARTISQPPLWPAKRLHYLQVPALWWAERRALRVAHRTFVCSEKDRRYLARTMRVSGLTVIPNAVEIHELDPPPPGRTALFVGSLSYGPNRVAAELLVREIWPRVRRRVPDARLTIAGRYPEQVAGYDAPPPGVEFTGFVEDLDAVYRRTRVACVPIQSGGGTRIKVLEAAAHGKPVVSTTVGIEGLAMVDGEHVLERNDPDAFAAAVADLLADDARCARMGRAARDLVRAEYARERVQARIRRGVLGVLDTTDSAPRQGDEQ